MAFSGIYDTMNTGSAVNRNLNDKTRSLFINDVADEELEFQKAAKKKEKASGLGRLLGGGGGLLASLLFPGLGTLATAAIAGAGSYVGQRAGAGGNLNVGKFNMQDDRDYSDMFKESMLANAGSDALMAGLLKHAGAFDKGIDGSKMGTEPVRLNTSSGSWKTPQLNIGTYKNSKFNPYDLYDIMGYGGF